MDGSALSVTESDLAGHYKKIGVSQFSHHRRAHAGDDVVIATT
jgi:hypothetical protein